MVLGGYEEVSVEKSYDIYVGPLANIVQVGDDSWCLYRLYLIKAIYPKLHRYLGARGKYLFLNWRKE